MDDSQNNVNDIYENKENSIEIDSVKKITNENFKCIENINTELENLSDNYDELNYLDNYDDLEVDKIVELFEELNLKKNNNEKNNENNIIIKKIGFQFHKKKD